jgi:hypothetical protein
VLDSVVGAFLTSPLLLLLLLSDLYKAAVHAVCCGEAACWTVWVHS